MQQKFNLEAAGRLLGITSSAMRARAKKNPEKYQLERDNRGQIWVWLDPEITPELKPSMKPAKAAPVQAHSDELKAAIQAVRDHAQAAMAAADLQGQIDVLRRDLAKAEQRAALAEVQAEERAHALEAAERSLAHLRSMLPPPPEAKPTSITFHSWWRRLFN